MMDLPTALRAAKCRGDFTLPELCVAQEMLEAAGYATEALTVEEYLIDQSDEAWEAAGIKPY
jgi:hypothetical protein